MSQSAWLIRPPTEQQQNPASAAPQRRAPAAPTTPAGGGVSPFAALMAGQEKKGADKSALVAARPEETGTTLQLRNPVLAGRSPSDLIRAQTFTKAQADLRQTQAMEGMMQSVSGGDSPLDLARNMGMARHLRSMTNSFEGRLNGLSMGDFIHTRSGAGR